MTAPAPPPVPALAPPPALLPPPGMAPGPPPAPPPPLSPAAVGYAKVVGTLAGSTYLSWAGYQTAAGCASACDGDAQCTHFIRSAGMADDVSGGCDLWTGFSCGSVPVTSTSGGDHLTITSYKLCAPPSAPPSPPPSVPPMEDGDAIGTISTSWQSGAQTHLGFTTTWSGSGAPLHDSPAQVLQLNDVVCVTGRGHYTVVGLQSYDYQDVVEIYTMGVNLGTIDGYPLSFGTSCVPSPSPPPPSPPPSSPPAQGCFFDKTTLKAAVDAWVADAGAAEGTHGPIAGWDVSRVDDMSEVFQHKNAFNDDIGAWDTSRVTNMQQTLKGAYAFNLELAWDTSKVTTMESTFQVAGAFSQPLVWDTSKVTNMKSAFQAAGSFNGELNWDTSSVTLLERTLYQATAFNRPLVWDVSKVTTMPNMLRETSFNQPASLAAWDVSKASAMTDMLTGSALASDGCSKVELRNAWQAVRSEERRVGKECYQPCRSRWSPYH